MAKFRSKHQCKIASANLIEIKLKQNVKFNISVPFTIQFYKNQKFVAFLLRALLNRWEYFLQNVSVKF